MALVSPVDSARTFVRFDVHLVEVDVNFGYFYLEAVGQKLDGLPDVAIAGPPWQRKEGLGSSGSCNNKVGWDGGSRRALLKHRTEQEQQHSLMSRHRRHR